MYGFQRAENYKQSLNTLAGAYVPVTHTVGWIQLWEEKWVRPPSMCVPVLSLENVRDWSALIVAKQERQGGKTKFSRERSRVKS